MFSIPPGNVGINTSAPLAKLHVDKSNVLLTGLGLVPTAPLPIEGDGSRLMWIADRSAFRAGWSQLGSWDNALVGAGSVAFGVGTEASGLGSLATGSFSRAAGHSSGAIGSQARATGDYSFAAGYNINALGNYSTVFGTKSSSLGDNAFTWGSYSAAAGNGSLALGSFLKSSGTGSYTIGSGVDALTPLTNGLAQSLAVGFNSDLATFVVTGGSGAGTFGRVGIGTASPQATLHVAGIGRFDSLAGAPATRMVVADSLGTLSSQAIPTGDITGVLAGSGLTGGGSAGDVTLAVNPGPGLGFSGGTLVNTGLLQTTPFGGDVSGTYDALHLNPGVVGPLELEPLAVHREHIALGAIGAAQVGNFEIGYGQLAPGAVGMLTLQDDSVTHAKMANDSIGYNELQDDAVTRAKIENNAVDFTKIAADSIFSTHIAAGQVIREHLRDEAVNADKIEDLAVTHEKLDYNSVGWLNIQDDAVHSAEILDETIKFRDIAPNGAIAGDVMTWDTSLPDGPGWAARPGAGGDPFAVRSGGGYVAQGSLNMDCEGISNVHHMATCGGHTTIDDDHVFTPELFITTEGHFGGRVTAPELDASEFAWVGSNGVDHGLDVQGQTWTNVLDVARYAFIGHDGPTDGLWIDGEFYCTRPKHFVQPHPEDPEKEIVFTCMEGPEAGVYARGTAQLVDGAASVDIPEILGLVISEVKPVTVVVTPLSADSMGLAVVARDAKHFEVRELQAGRGSYEFDFIVTGERAGYEDMEPIRARTERPERPKPSAARQASAPPPAEVLLPQHGALRSSTSPASRASDPTPNSR